MSSPPDRDAPARLTLWGPSAAGKTALLAQLHLHLEDRDGVDAAWETFPADAETVDFFVEMRRLFVEEGHFPPPTPLGPGETLRYELRERATGDRALLTLEDRAGALFERHDESVRERLAESDGLVLLFDPLRDPMRLRAEIVRALEQIHIERDAGGEPDPRPIAVCLSKADGLVRDFADHRQAIEDPDAFVRRHLDPTLVRSLDRYCSRYRFFPVSAVGLDLVQGMVTPRLLVDERGRTRPVPGGATLPLLAPFVWVFDQHRQALGKAS